VKPLEINNSREPFPSLVRTERVSESAGRDQLIQAGSSVDAGITVGFSCVGRKNGLLHPICLSVFFCHLPLYKPKKNSVVAIVHLLGWFALQVQFSALLLCSEFQTLTELGNCSLQGPAP
jgi:hypothetical protein